MATYRPAAMIPSLATWRMVALVLFWPSLLFHVAVVAGLVIQQPWMAVGIPVPFILNQFVTQPHMRHAPVGKGRRPQHALWSRWSTWRVALRYVPLGWRVFGLPLYVIYAPLMFFGAGHFWTPAIAVSVFPAMVFLNDYVCLAFVIPNRQAILAAVGHEQESKDIRWSRGAPGSPQ